MITYLNVWRAWTDHGRSGAWAYRHFVSHKALLRAEDIRVRLRAQLKHLGEPLATCGTDPGPVCKVRQPSCAGAALQLFVRAPGLLLPAPVVGPPVLA